MSATGRAALRPRRAYVAALAIAAASQLPVGLTGALGAQLQAELGRNDAASGLAISAFFASGALLSVALGRLVDRIGWSTSVRLAGAVTIGALLGVAALVRSWPVMGLLLAIAGAAFALAMPASNVALAEEAAPERLGLAIGAKQAALPVASMLAGVTVPLVALTIGWRWAFVMASGLALLAIAAAPGDADGSAAAARRRAQRPRAGLSTGLLRLGVAVTITSMIPGTMLAFLVVTSVRAGVSESLAGVAFTVASLLTLVVRVAAGWWMDRRGGDGLTATAVLAAIGGIGALLLATRRPLLMVIGGIIGLGGSWGWGGLIFLGVVRRNPTAPGAATGVVQTGASLGTTISPVLFGVVAQAAGHSVAWIGVALLSVLAAVLTEAAARTMRRTPIGSAVS